MPAGVRFRCQGISGIPGRWMTGSYRANSLRPRAASGPLQDDPVRRVEKPPRGAALPILWIRGLGPARARLFGNPNGRSRSGPDCPAISRGCGHPHKPRSQLAPFVYNTPDPGTLAHLARVTRAAAHGQALVELDLCLHHPIELSP